MLAFAEHLVGHSSRLWVEADLDQRQRLQKLFFPEGLTWAYGEFRTGVTCLYFTNLEGISGAREEMVALMGLSSNPVWDSNRIYAWLHEVADLKAMAA